MNNVVHSQASQAFVNATEDLLTNNGPGGDANGIPIIMIPYCNTVRCKETGQLYPWTPVLAERGDLFEPYNGEVRVDALRSVELALLTMVKNAPPEQLPELRRKITAYRNNEITAEEIVAAGNKFYERQLVQQSQTEVVPAPVVIPQGPAKTIDEMSQADILRGLQELS